MESGQDNEALSPGSEVRKQTLEPLASPTYLTVKRNVQTKVNEIHSDTSKTSARRSRAQVNSGYWL